MPEFIYHIPREVTEPFEQREEIVRCRDCKFYDQNPILSGCTQFDFGMSKDMSNGFCAWGKRQ